MPRGYGQFCPVAMASEVFAERWTPLVLRELCAGRSSFNDIHKGVPLMSRTLLAQRLRDLVEVGVVTVAAKTTGRGQAYCLSTAGLALCPIIEQLGDWGTLFARSRIGPASCDPSFLMWALRSYVDRRLLPDRRLVVRFAFRGLEPAFRAMPLRWLVAVDGDLDVCWEDRRRGGGGSPAASDGPPPSHRPARLADGAVRLRPRGPRGPRSRCVRAARTARRGMVVRSGRGSSDGHPRRGGRTVPGRSATCRSERHLAPWAWSRRRCRARARPHLRVTRRR